MAKIDIYNPEEKYDILYTDPPWQQGRGGKKACRPNSTGMSVPYETMDVPGIMELHRYVTNELMNEKHNVFMWTIDKYLPQTEEIRENSRRCHSKKPECAYQMIETFFPQAKKLELFARTERDGWDQWGNEL